MIKVQNTKTLITKPNNNSANCIAPNVIYGCFGGCVDTYCYMSRYNGRRVFVNKNVDGGILTFNSTHPKWSYAKTDENGKVVEVAEKNPISENATVGVYYWKSGKDYVKYANQMIDADIRVNNEFYVCPVYNEALKDNKNVIIHEIEKMWGIGTPEDLESFLEDYKSNL